MRKKNGFTLVEIISVIGILALISAITIPSIITMNNRNKEKNYQKIVENIKTSSENFIEENRNDIPFNVDGEYYFKLKTLGSFNLLKLPIKDPRTNNGNINEEQCIKVTKNDDGTILYEFPVECKINTQNVVLEIDKSDTYIKKGTSIDYDNYVTKKEPANMELKTTDVVDTNKEGTQRIGFYLADPANAIFKNFIVMDDQNINIVFLSDSITKQERDAANLDEWGTELETKLLSNSPYEESGIKFNINIKKINTTGGGETTYDDQKIGSFVDSGSNTSNNATNITYYGIYDDKMVASMICSECDPKIVLLNINSGKTNTLSGDDCGYTDDKNTIYCHEYESDVNIAGESAHYEVYREYKLQNGEYTLNDDADRTWLSRESQSEYTPNKASYNALKSLYESSNSNWNTRKNPDGLTYNYSTTQLRNILKNKLGENWPSEYYADSFKNIFKDDEKGIGYLMIRQYEGTSTGKFHNYDPYILWINENPEKFEVDLNTYSGYDKIYLIVTANNTNKYTQKLNIANSHLSSGTFYFIDDNTKSNFNIAESTTYTNMDAILADLENKIK